MLNKIDYKSKLNQEQLQAIYSSPGEMLIVAGAGTGKTSTIVAKIVYAVETGFAEPGQIVATTFTNKAASELKSRLQKHLGDQAKSIIVGTFHSISLEILQRNSAALSLNSINVASYDDQIQIVRSILSKYSLKDVRASIVLEQIQRHKEEQSVVPGIDFRIINEYQSELTRLNVMDFADLLIKTIQLLKENETVQEVYRNNLRLICVDEYQDINDLQHNWVSHIYDPSKHHLCCVGDSDQAIYGFRGANADHILNFGKTFPNAQMIKLERNYRSTQNILENANKLISHNKNRIVKELFANNGEAGPKILMNSAHSSRLEAENICELINRIKRKETEKQSIAILVRNRNQIVDIEESLIKNQISYKIYGAMQFLDRTEIKDMMSYLKFIHNMHDSMSFNRLMQCPKRRLGPVTFKKIQDIADEYNIDLLEAMRILEKTSPESIKIKLTSVLNLLDEAVKLKDKGLIVLANHIYVGSRYIETIGPERRENMQQWIRSLADFDSIAEYLDKILWQADEEQEAEHDAEVMTIHASKGLEFDYVFLPGWEEGILPHDFSTRDKEIEEERRLAYVALTRARKQVIISCASSRMINGNIKSYPPSRFLRELKEFEHCSIGVGSVFKNGSEVIHPRFGLGRIEESGSGLARVRFSNTVRLVEIKMLRIL